MPSLPLVEHTGSPNAYFREPSGYPKHLIIEGWTDVQFISPIAGLTSSGQILAPNGTAGAPGISFASDPTSGIMTNGTGTIGISAQSVNVVGMSPGRFTIRNGYSLGFSSGADPVTSGADVTLFRDAANTLALRNGVNQQTLSIYNTYTDASNYERISIRTPGASGPYILGPEVAGTGIAKPLTVNAASVFPNIPSTALTLGANTGIQWSINTGGHFVATADNVSDIGAAGANRVRSVYSATSFNVANGSAVMAYDSGAGGAVTLIKMAGAGSFPGAGFGKLYFRDGTNGGTLRLVVRAGAAGAETTILDNIPQ